jgi:hypothetical protein
MLPIGQCLRDELVRRDYAASTVRGYTQTEGSNPPDRQFSCARAPLSTPRSP